MADSPVLAEVHLRVGPYSGGQVAVHFEPTGMIYELLEGDWLEVTMRGPSLGLVEIGHTPDAVIVGSWPDAEVLVRASDGTQLEV
jgi:hypothetical protein